MRGAHVRAWKGAPVMKHILRVLALCLLLALPACALAKALDRFCERRFQAFGLRTRFPLFSAMRSRNDGTSSRRASAGVNLRVRATKMR